MAVFDWLRKRLVKCDFLPTRTLYVGNLATNVTRRRLRRLFGCYGRVVNVQIPTHPVIRTPSLGFGFVEMADGADAAIAALNGATFEGRELKVQDARIREKKESSISSDEFRAHLLPYQRHARELIVTPGDPGCLPETKISGVPWWPSDRPRPHCSHGHAMSFMAQFLLSDIPTFESHGDSLVAFHYCHECSYEGNTSYGWDDRLGNKDGYDISVINGIAGRQPDGLGVIAEVAIDPQSVAFRNVMDAPGYEDTMRTIDLPSVPDDYPRGDDEFDEDIYPGVIHIARSKVGGWPTWVQNSEPPETNADEQLHFIGQLDWMLCDRATWCTGGYACLFLISSKDQASFRGELSVQTT